MAIGRSSGGDGGNAGGGATIITSVQPPQKPLNLLMAVSEIQQFSAIEKNATEQIDPNFFTIQQRIDFFAAGVKNAFTHFLFILIFTPFAVAVLHGLIPIFGDKSPNLFDKIYALMLDFSVSLGFGVFLASLKNCYVGNVTKAMIRNLFGGLVMGEIAKDFVTAAIYGWLYLMISPQNIVDFLRFLDKHFHEVLVKLHVNLIAVYYWIMNFKSVLIISTILAVISSAIMIGIPSVVILISAIKNKPSKDDF